MAENIISSESGEKYAQIKHSLQALTVQISAKQICWWILGEQQGMDFFTKRKHYGILARNYSLQLKS